MTSEGSSGTLAAFAALAAESAVVGAGAVLGSVAHACDDYLAAGDAAALVVSGSATKNSIIPCQTFNFQYHLITAVLGS